MISGTDEASGLLFSYADLEERIPGRYPLRKIRQVVKDLMASLGADFACCQTETPPWEQGQTGQRETPVTPEIRMYIVLKEPKPSML